MSWQDLFHTTMCSGLGLVRTLVDALALLRGLDRSGRIDDGRMVERGAWRTEALPLRTKISTMLGLSGNLKIGMDARGYHCVLSLLSPWIRLSSVSLSTCLFCPCFRSGTDSNEGITMIGSDQHETCARIVESWRVLSSCKARLWTECRMWS